jgi:MFS family permease
MIMKENIRSNIWKITVSDVLYGFGIINSIRLLFFNDLGYNSFHLGIYEVVTSITIVASDLFTGVIADRIGRKNSVLISNLSFLLLAIILGTSFLYSGGFWAILISCAVLNGLEFSFRSGAKSALLYDSLIQLEQETQYLKISGRINAFSIISNVSGMLIGGFLFDEVSILPLWVWFIFILASSIILLTVQEPQIPKTESRSFWNDVKLGVKYIFNSKSILWLILFFLYLDVFAESYWDTFSQTHMQMFIANKVGVIFGVIGGFCAIASYFVEKIEKLIGQKWLLYGIVGFQIIIFLGIAWATTWYMLAIFLLALEINRNISWLLSDNYQNKLIPSEHRAAILSAASFLNNGVFGGGIIILAIGWLIPRVNFSILFTILAILIFFINGSLLIVRDTRIQKKQPLV